MHTPICSITLLVGMFGSTPPPTDPASPPMLPSHIEQRFNDMEAEIARLRALVGENWMTEQRADQIRELVSDMLADADTRASLLENGALAGWDNGFFIASADGNFKLNIGGNIQFRYIFNDQDNAPEDEDNTRFGFENTRTQLIFTGHVINPNWIYRVQGNFSRDGGDMFLEDAYLGHAFGNGWTALAGQFRVPMLREFLVTEPRQQFVERSLVHQEFTAGRTQGAALDYRGEQFHLTMGYTDGHPASGGFNHTALSLDTEYSLTARLEGLFAGTWDQFNEYASWPGEDFGMLFGGAVHYQQAEYGTTDDNLEVLQWTLDASAKFGGANLFAYVVGRHLDDNVMLERDQYGIVIQGGFFLTDDVDIFARYEWGDDDTGAEDLSVITAGVNWYFAKHRLKWTNDIGYGLNEVSETWGDGFLGLGGSIAGWRTDSPGSHGQIVIRSQMQLLF